MTDANGLYYMRARYYSPELKRFINADVVAGDISNAITLNRYAYANGNPVSNVDPFGLEAERTLLNEEDYFAMYQEHHKKGTTNPSNRAKHESGQARKNKDNRGEKGDARRTSRSNKRPKAIVSGDNYDDVVILLEILGLLYLLANDLTGAGVYDDFTIPPLLYDILEKLAEFA